jgi:hypothetical protein
MDELERWLGHERQLLDRLLFKLVVGRELLATGELRFLGLATAEVQRAASRVQEADLVRAVQLSRLAGEWEVPVENLTLETLSWATPEPYRTLFEDHLTGFLSLLVEIDGVAAQAGRMAAQGARTHAHAGYPAMLSATVGVSLTSLADFLGDPSRPLEAVSSEW